MAENVNDASTDTNDLELSEASPRDDSSGGHERRRKKSIVWALLDEYFSNASISGIQYINERNRHWSERLIWVVAFLVSLCLSGYLISGPWRKWNQTPVIVTFDEKTTPIWNIPFPAVTICPETKFNISKLNFTEVYSMITRGNMRNLSDDQINNMHAAALICLSPLLNYDDYKDYNAQNFTDDSIFKTIEHLSSSRMKETILACIALHREDCLDFFNPILTEDGICFTFNSLNSRDIYTDAMDSEMLTVTNNPQATYWNLEDGYFGQGESDLNEYPYRMPNAGIQAGVFLVLQTYQKDLDYLCRGPIQGFKITLHSPNEVPQVSKYFYRVPLDQEVSISVQPQMITTKDPHLRKYSSELRGCYFNSDRPLKFFKTYNQRNCELECVANFTLEQCGCVGLSMPREKSTPICGISKFHCTKSAEHRMLTEYFETKPINHRCDCLPACTSISYNAEISQAKCDTDKMAIAYALHDNLVKGKQLALSKIFFKENQFTTSKRSELYGTIDFLANCGGLLGLCIGISVLGIVELIYSFILRLCCTIRSHRQRHEQNQNN